MIEGRITIPSSDSVRVWQRYPPKDDVKSGEKADMIRETSLSLKLSEFNQETQKYTISLTRNNQ